MSRAICLFYFGLLAGLLVGVSAATPAAAPNTLIQRFTLVERYGVSHPEQIITQALAGKIDPAQCRLVDPFGKEVPFQLLDGGRRIAFSASLPASRIRLQKVMFNYPDKNDPTVTRDHWAYRHLSNMNHALSVPPGTMIRFTHAKLPPMIQRGKTYYLTAPRGGTHADDHYVSISETLDGPPVVFEPNGILNNYIYSGHLDDDFIAESLPLIVLPNGRIGAPAHGYRAGETVRVVSDGTPPAPLARGSVYRVAAPDTDSFALADTAGKPVVLTSEDDGRTELYVERSWTLLRGTPVAAADHLVAVKEAPDYFEIANGLTGVRVPKSSTGPLDLQALASPLQGLLLGNGTWVTSVSRFTAEYAGAMTARTVIFLERGPLVTTVRVRYQGEQKEIAYPLLTILGFNAADSSLRVNFPYLDMYQWSSPDAKPVRLYGGGKDAPLPAPFKEGGLYYARRVADRRYQLRETPDGPLVSFTQTTAADNTTSLGGIHVILPAHPAESTTTFTLQAGQPSVMIEEDSNLDSRYSIDFANEVHPDTGRYRGYRASPSLQAGRAPDGKPYTNYNYSLTNAEVDLPVADPYAWFYGYYPYAYSGNAWYYYQLFDKKAGDDTPVVGIFPGPASKTEAVNQMVGPKFFVKNPKDGPRQLGIEVWNTWRGPDMAIYLRARWAWCIMTGLRRDMIKAPDALQPIQIQHNIHAGVNLDKVAQLTANFPDRPGGYGPLYMPKSAVDTFVKRLREDPAYEKTVMATAGGSASIIRFMKEATREQFDNRLVELNFQAYDMLNEMVNRGGIYAGRYLYWLGGLECSQSLPWLNALLGSALATPEDTARLKAVATLFAAVLYDNDHTPIDTGTAGGTANMGVQQRAFRGMYALMLPKHPLLASRVGEIATSTRDVFDYSHNDAGASWSSIHYVSAGDGPLLATLQMLQTAGVADAFRDDPKVAKFAEFYMQALTPREPRYRMLRRLVPIGDGATEGSEMYGVLATGLVKSHPELAMRLMGAWRENGRVHSDFHASTHLRIDDTLPDISPQLGDASFPGYYSVLRSGWGTPWENAVWCRNGTYCSDHAHNDMGEVVAYLLGAPLSLDWGSFYTPRIAGSTMHSTVVPERAFDSSWDKPSVGGASFNQGTRSGAEASGLDTWAEGHHLASTIRSDTATWRRDLTLVDADAEVPVLLIRDTFTGPAAGEAKVMTLNLAAEGAVETPAGRQTPPSSMHPVANYDPAHGPTVGPVFDLPQGVSRLGFTGAALKEHPSGGIDFDVYCVAAAPQQAHVGAWGCRENGEAEQKQYILRVRGTGPFTTVVVPWCKGAKPEGMKVTADPAGITVIAGTATVRFTEAGYTVMRGGKTIDRRYGVK
jgi:hypothetical protein